MNITCYNCVFLVDTFGNFVQCSKTGRFVDYEYWNDIPADNCPFNKKMEIAEDMRGEENV